MRPRCIGKPRDWWLAGGRLFQVFLQPVRFGGGGDSPEIGVLALGSAVDERLAAEVGRVAGSPVAFCNEDRVPASTSGAAAARESRL